VVVMTEEAAEERQEIDPVFKQIVEDAFAAYKVTCQTQYEVGRLPRTIDALVTIEDQAEQQKIRTETLFFYFLKHNQLEFKGHTGAHWARLTKKGYHTIRGRMEFLLREKAVSPFDTTVTIISAGRPRTVLTYANDLKRPFVAMAQKGYYKSDEYPPIYLIVVNELPIVPKHYPLLLFAASEQKFREFLEQVITVGEYTYVRYAYEVRPHVTKEVLTMAGVTSRLSRKDLEFMAEDIGPEIIAVMDAEKLLKGLNAEKGPALLSQVLATGIFEEWINGISPDHQKRLFELVLKRLAADLTDESKSGRNGND
jgi:hypothetical protein